MNYSTAVLLINDNIKVVAATYEAEDHAKVHHFKTVNEEISVDDLVIVPSTTRHKMTVVKVKEVNVDLDFDTTEDVKWIVGVIDADHFTQLQEQEAGAIKAIKDAKRNKEREDLKQAMFANYSDEIKALPIANIGSEETSDKSE